MTGSRLYYGDNLEILRSGEIPNESIDLVYLDPPFNSTRVYNVLFASSGDAQAQIQAFDDTWVWSNETERQYDQLLAGGLPEGPAIALEAMRALLRESNMLAYLVNMTPRLVYLHRVLKNTGSLYLHCDPTASHYLKIILDAIFGPENFRSEIIWKRTSGHSDASRFGSVHDTILFYAKSRNATWNQQYQAYDDDYVEQYYRYTDDDGRRFMSGDLSAAGLAGGGYTYTWKGIDRVWRAPRATMEQYEKEGRIFYTRNGFPRLKRFLDEAKGLPAQDVWTDIEALRSWHAEKLGYPTQKPLALLERIISSSTNPGDTILDPFCGCGTALDAAINLGRTWIGIDITYIAIDLIRNRLRKTHGDAIDKTYEVRGVPADLAAAHALFDRSPFDFERWAVSMVNGTPNEKQVADRGSDGSIRFMTGRKSTARAVVSVKGGKQLNPGMVRDLEGVVSKTRGAELGVLITLHTPTRGMRDAAATSGNYTDWLGNSYPRVQLLTVTEILAGAKPKTPPVLAPYLEPQRKQPEAGQQLMIVADETAAAMDFLDEVDE